MFYYLVALTVVDRVSLVLPGRYKEGKTSSQRYQSRQERNWSPTTCVRHVSQCHLNVTSFS